MRYLTMSTLIGMLLPAIGAAAALELPAQPPNPPAFTWAGFHVGGAIPLYRERLLEAGSGFTSNAFDLHPKSIDHSGFSFGAHVGFDWQYGPWVYGLETELNFLDARPAPNGLYLAPPAYGPLGIAAYGISSDPSGNYFSDFRGRFGFAVDRMLFTSPPALLLAGGAEPLC
ncbi:outer membrane protein [Methylocapsa aurea]|uniref:outer membrane protein n=1 Tax=Methylocapsa aurea TaxID=663610 RepID=UPI000563D6AE|nr:hypothetical protein [Methylocapsa aurea]